MIIVEVFVNLIEHEFLNKHTNFTYIIEKEWFFKDSHNTFAQSKYSRNLFHLSSLKAQNIFNWEF